MNQTATVASSADYAQHPEKIKHLRLEERNNTVIIHSMRLKMSHAFAILRRWSDKGTVTPK